MVLLPFNQSQVLLLSHNEGKENRGFFTGCLLSREANNSEFFKYSNMWNFVTYLNKLSYPGKGMMGHDLMVQIYNDESITEF